MTTKRLFPIAVASSVGFAIATVWAQAPAPTSEPAAGSGSVDSTGSAGSAVPTEGSATPAPEPAKPPTDVRTFAGSIQLDYLAVPTDSHARATTFDGATAELSLRITKDFTPHASATVKICFACHGFEAALGFVELRTSDDLRFRIGRINPAFGAFAARHDPANHLLSDKPLPYDMGRMVERDAFNEGILPAPWVDNGLEIGGTHFWDGGRIDYAGFVTSGPKGGPDAVDFDFTLSRAPEQYYVDNNSQPAVGGHVGLELEVGAATFAVGASGMVGHYDPDRELSFAIGGVDAALKRGRFTLRGEYLIRRTEMSLGDDPAARFKYGPVGGSYDAYFVKDGFYVEAEAPLGPLTLLVRWDGLRRAGNVLATSALSDRARLLRYTGGLAIPIQSRIQLKTSLELYDFNDLDNQVAVHVGAATAF